uniref:Galactose-specific lectin nattectin-like n=1 Tax=Crassostrea virginica TaxID=6565 RepID=A0A8B8BHJ2_CRAVI|nr:galactose-specific lectin nattectin-like [Crassostrea virginica]XP_022302842.1 galactose-specific lectin nattectin-like [Crassostrea virginica]
MNKDIVHACLALWIVLLSQVEDSEELCPEGFFHHGSSCYFFSANFESDWIEAGFFCNRFNGGDLVSIETQSENSYIYSILNLMHSDRAFWIGGTDGFVEGHWVWISTMQAMTVTDWGESLNHTNDSSNDCLQIQAVSNDHTPYWQPAHCSDKTNFICEIPIPDGSHVVG